MTSPRQAIAQSAARHQVPTAAIYGRTRTALVVAARGDVVVALRHAGMTWPAIGQELDRDHSTVMAIYRRHHRRPADTTCTTPQCDRRPIARTLCQPCYRRAHRQGTLPPRQRAVHDVPCKVDGCGRPPKGRGWCSGHYQRVLKHGDPQAHVPLRPGPGVTTRTAVVDGVTHGTLSGYQAGCGCLPCRDAKYAWQVAYRRGEARDVDPAVPTGPARAHVAALVRLGMSLRQIARQAGVSHDAVRRLTHRSRTRQSTATAVLAVRPSCPDCGGPAAHGGRWCGVGRCTARGRWSWSRSAA